MATWFGSTEHREHLSDAPRAAAIDRGHSGVGQMKKFKVTATHTVEECTTCAEIRRRLDEWPGEACAKSGTSCIGFKEAIK